MAIRYDIIHTTVYRYRQPVTFGEHRVMFRPRDSTTCACSRPTSTSAPIRTYA